MSRPYFFFLCGEGEREGEGEGDQHHRTPPSKKQGAWGGVAEDLLKDFLEPTSAPI